MDEQGRTVVRKFLMGLLAVIVLFALVWFIFLRDSGDGDNGNPTGADTSQSTSNSKENNTAKNQPANTKSPATGPGGSAQVGGAQTGSGQNSAQTGQLAATGPGNPVTIFLSAAIVAALGHYLYMRRKLKLNRQ